MLGCSSIFFDCFDVFYIFLLLFAFVPVCFYQSALGKFHGIEE